MEKPTPFGVHASWVDEKGRLRKPADFRKTMELHPEWFIEQAENGFYLQTSPQSGERVEVDPTGRMQIPSSLSAEFKSREVRLVWASGRIEVITGEEFEKRLTTIQSVLKFPHLASL